jgi:hypothetical protein
LRRSFALQHRELAPLDLGQGFAADDRFPSAEDGGYCDSEAG